MKNNRFLIFCAVAALLITLLYIGWKRDQEGKKDPVDIQGILNHSELPDKVEKLDTMEYPVDDTMPPIQNFPYPDSLKN